MRPRRCAPSRHERWPALDLPADLLDLLRSPSLGFIATTMPDGSPQLTQVWVDTDGEHVVVNSELTTEGAAEHIELLSRKYLGTPYPWYGGRDQVRVKLVIGADHVSAMR